MQMNSLKNPDDPTMLVRRGEQIEASQGDTPRVNRNLTRDFTLIALGFIFAVPCVMYLPSLVAEHMQVLTVILGVVLLATVGSGVLVTLYHERILKSVFGSVLTDVESIVKHAKDFADALNDKKTDVAISAAASAASIAGARYSSMTARRWIVGSSISIVVAWFALVGSGLMVRQNEILSSQTHLQAEQTDATRIEKVGLLRERAAQIRGFAARIAGAHIAIQAAGQQLTKTHCTDECRTVFVLKAVEQRIRAGAGKTSPPQSISTAEAEAIWVSGRALEAARTAVTILADDSPAKQGRSATGLRAAVEVAEVSCGWSAESALMVKKALTTLEAVAFPVLGERYDGPFWEILLTQVNFFDAVEKEAPSPITNMSTGSFVDKMKKDVDVITAGLKAMETQCRNVADLDLKEVARVEALRAAAAAADPAASAASRTR